MKIEQYVRATRHNLESPIPVEKFIPKETQEIFNELIKNHFKKQITIYPLCSSNVFPETIYFNHELYLLWDNMFWEYFDTYMVCIACINTNQNNLKLIEFAKTLLRNLYIEILAYKLEKFPELSFCLVNDIIQLDNRRGTILEIISTLDDRFKPIECFSSVFIQARLYVFLHEMYHVYFSDNQEEYKEITTTIRKICKIFIDNDLLKHLTSNLDESLKNSVDNSFISILNGTNTKLLNEITSDFKSFKFLKNLTEQIYNEEKYYNSCDKAIKDIQETMRFCMNFHTEINLLVSVWKEKIKLAETIIFSSDYKSLDNEEIITKHNQIIDSYKNDKNMRFNAFFHIIQFDSIMKDSTFSPLNDIFANIDLIKTLKQISDNLMSSDYIWLKAVEAFTLREKSNLMQNQKIEARDMLITLKKKILNASFMS